jgi:O-antigen/teichoic acid export membrane protein
VRAVQRIAKNTFVLSSAEAINKILSLILYIAVANYLKVAGYGQFAFIMTLLALFTVLANFGLDKLTIREIAKEKKKTQIYLTSMLKLKFFLAVVSYIILAIFIYFSGKPPIVIHGTYLIGLAILCIALSNTFLAIFNSHERLEINSFLLVAVKLLILGLVGIFIFTDKGLLFILSAFFIGELFRLILAWLVYIKVFHHKKIERVVHFPYKKTLILALPFVIAAVASLIHMHIDILMLSLIKGDRPAGWYSAAYNLIVGLVFIPRAYTLSIFPVISRYAKDSQKMLYFSWQKSVKLISIISLPLCLGSFVLAHRFIYLLYDPTYENSIGALRILSLALPLMFLSSINYFILYAINKERQVTIIIIACAFLNVICNFLLIPKFSYIGAAWSTIFSELAAFFMLLWIIFTQLKYNMRDFNFLIKPLVAALIMGGLVYYLNWLNLVLIMFISAIFYTILIILLRTFDKSDKELLQIIFSKLKQKH